MLTDLRPGRPLQTGLHDTRLRSRSMAATVVEPMSSAG